jgi:hypothetical protein
MTQYANWEEWLKAEPDALEPFYRLLDEIIQGVMDDGTGCTGIQDKADVLKENE